MLSLEYQNQLDMSIEEVGKKKQLYFSAMSIILKYNGDYSEIYDIWRGYSNVTVLLKL